MEVIARHFHQYHYQLQLLDKNKLLSPGGEPSIGSPFIREVPPKEEDRPSENNISSTVPLSFYKPTKLDPEFKNSIGVFNEMDDNVDPEYIIETISKRNKQTLVSIQSLFSEQKQLFLNPTQEILKNMKLKQQNLYQELQKQFHVLKTLFQNFLLDLQPLHQYYYVINEVDLQIKKTPSTSNR